MPLPARLWQPHGAVADSPSGSCPISASEQAKRLYRLAQFSIHRCRECDQVYLWPVPDPEVIRAQFAELYSSGTGSVPELESYYGFCYENEPSNPLVQLYEHWLDAVERFRAPGKLLDVGCGTGLFMDVARKRGWDPYGVDECSEAIEHARGHFGLDVREGQFAEFRAEGRRFDAITMWDIIEHTREPVDLLQTARACLAAVGIIALSTPNQRSVIDVVAGALYRGSGGLVRAPLEKFYIDQHFLYFTPDSLERAVRRAGLQLLYLRRELTDLRRLTLTPAKRLLLRGLFLAARASGLENRILAVASSE